jgi:ATP-binding cassette subfamily B protein
MHSTSESQSSATLAYLRDPLVELEADLLEDGSFGTRHLVVTAEQVQVLDQHRVTEFQIPIADIRTARNEPLVGGGRLEVTTRTGEILPIISYTNSSASRFSEAARGIEQLAKDEEFSINLKPEQTRCSNCNRLLPEKDGVCPSCVNRTRTMVRLAQFLVPYKKQAVFLALLSFTTTLLNLVPPYLQGRIVGEVFEKQANTALLFQLMGVWLAVAVSASLVNITRDRLNSWLAGNIAADLRSRVYRAIEFLQVTFFDKKQVGAISSRVTSDTDRVWGFLVEGIPYFLLNGMMLVGVLTFLFIIHPIMALAVVLPIPVMVFIGMRFWRPMSQMWHRVGQKWARFHTHLNESLNGIRVVKAFAREDSEYHKFTIRNHELRDAGVKADARWFTIFGGMIFFTTLGTLLTWTVGGILIIRQELKLSQFIMVVGYLGQVYGPLQWFAAINNWFTRAMAGADRIFEVVDMSTERYGQGTKAPIVGEVTFENVRFGYDKSNPVLKGIQFTAKPGEMIGLVGKSGAGKSTTINLIARFYEPDSGTIKIDGKDYRDLDLQDLRHQIGIVLQEPFLFNGTIADNIAYGKPGATLDDVMEAAKAANAHNFILSKPDGYDTMVGERGAKMSGGERQRVSIARAILHDPRILILDEATSSVDVETEKQIQDAIQKLISGRTTFAIAHRLSTLRNADRLVVLDRGEIAEIGTHQELMDKKGAFFKLVETQSKIQEIVGLAYTEGDEPEATEEVDWQ